MEILIDRGGRPREPNDVDVASAVWDRGFVHLRRLKRWVIVSLNPKLVQETTLAAAFYEIADLDPAQVCLITDRTACLHEIFVGCGAAFRRISDLFSAEGHRRGGHSLHLRPPLACRQADPRVAVRFVSSPRL